MKGLLIIFVPALEEMVMQVLAEAGEKKYTKFPYLHGVGEHSEPHLDTSIWPSSNMALLVVTDEVKGKKILAGLAPLKEKYLAEGLTVFALPLEELL